MKSLFALIFCILSLSAILPIPANAWGRHDLITRIALDSSELMLLKKIQVTPESIESAAPDLLKRVIPDLEVWCERYHREHDTRYGWKIPKSRNGLNDRETLLWDLEDNINTRLDMGRESNAADILVRYVSEPDGMLDGGLDRSPYIERLRESMSYFGSDDVNTHAFRHYYVPSSMVPPIFTPKGIAPYRADLYAQLSTGAFKAGHPYWGYRFLAWSLHYAQDVTQPWHTIFLPGISFLQFSKSGMKHEISSLHYLTEAFADSWLLQAFHGRSIAGAHDITPILDSQKNSLWFVSELVEKLAIEAHHKASSVADLARSLFKPIVEQLGPDLKLKVPAIHMGDTRFVSAILDFSNDGAGATEFLSPIWNVDFGLDQPRDCLLRELVQQINAAISGSRLLVSHVLREASFRSITPAGAIPDPG